MRRTAWTSSVPSDRVPPSRSSTPNRNKGKAKDNAPPQSKEVRKLQELLTGLQNGTAIKKGANGACFCQARTHPLSQYTPLCMKCGFILCSLHMPAYPCPHCSTPLTDGNSRDSLISKLTQEIADVLQREEEERERQRLEREKAAGAFPTLGVATGSLEPLKLTQPHKVMSLNQQTRKVTVASYSTVTPARPHLAEQEETVHRVPRPPREVDYVKSKVNESGRRWENPRGERILYVPAITPKSASSESSRGGRRKKRVKNGETP